MPHITAHIPVPGVTWKAETLFATLSFENDKAEEIPRQNRIDRLTSILKALDLVLKTDEKRRKEVEAYSGRIRKLLKKEIKDSPEISGVERDWLSIEIWDGKFDDMLAYMLTN
ncbi:hypothetical protein CONLIGDRAFT_627780 [Coniochaeta ligniaria NRRL 30616]|uniref:Uncharacterized protein n=1 Tax=Coniochaeta ligniaria NRRL 30616 TaxID=1408157 RepID=A0A1J7IZZ9_9PEZI|nr:hypothetical protein CONLIGDRAFT_627780 [Coniochaeta ligniaria NRRL 30616]